jgi:hypothetical protein
VFVAAAIVAVLRGGIYSILWWIDDHTIYKTVYSDKEVLVIQQIENKHSEEVVQEWENTWWSVGEEIDWEYDRWVTGQRIEDVLNKNIDTWWGSVFLSVLSGATVSGDARMIQEESIIQNVQQPILLPTASWEEPDTTRVPAPSVEQADVRVTTPPSVQTRSQPVDTDSSNDDEIVWWVDQQLPDIDDKTRQLLIRQSLEAKKSKDLLNEQQLQDNQFRESVSEVIKQIQDNNFSEMLQQIIENNSI